MGATIDYANKVTVQNLDTFYITGGGYINYPFKGISRDSSMGWDEITWGGNLSRTVGSFALTNIDDVDFGSVFRFEVNFKYMNESDYKVLRAIAHQRHFTLTGLNRDTGVVESHEMTFTKTEMAKLYAFGTSFYGGLDISITAVATNRDRLSQIANTYTISYNNNSTIYPGATGTIDNQSAKHSENIKLADNSNSAMTLTGYKIGHWATNANDTGEKFELGQSVTVWKNYTLYAIWEENS